MNLTKDLLSQAEHLINKEPKRPKQASLRRATSNAYYALFHALTWGASALIGPNLATDARIRVVRWFDHGAMYKACGSFSAPTLNGELERLAGSTVSPEIQLVARSFRLLQQERHSADYDLSSNWNRQRAKQAIQNANDAVTAWNSVNRSSHANVFALALLDLDRTMKSRG